MQLLLYVKAGHKAKGTMEEMVAVFKLLKSEKLQGQIVSNQNSSAMLELRNKLALGVDDKVDSVEGGGVVCESSIACRPTGFLFRLRMFIAHTIIYFTSHHNP